MSKVDHEALSPYTFDRGGDETGTYTHQKQFAQRLRGVLGRINAVIREVIAEEKLFNPKKEALVDFNPSLHPRDPRTGKFVESGGVISDIVDSLPDIQDINSETDALSAKNEIIGSLIDKYGRESIHRNRDAITVDRTLSAWGTSGYWDEDVEPLWEAASEFVGGSEIPNLEEREFEESLPPAENTVEAFKDIFRVSQEKFANEFGESKTVYRALNDDLAQKAREAVEDGEPIEIDPRALESWSLSKESAEDWGEVIIERDISPEDVGIIGPMVLPNMVDAQEVTTLDNGKYEINPENINEAT